MVQHAASGYPSGSSAPMAYGPGAVGSAAPAPRSSRLGLWILLGAVVFGLVAGAAVLVGGGFLEEHGKDRRSARAEKKKGNADKGKDDTGAGSKEGPRAGASAAPDDEGPGAKPGPLKAAARSPSSPNTPTTAPAQPTTSEPPKASGRNIGGAKAVVQSCWFGNEGQPGKSTPASSATITVTFGANSVYGVAVSGPASQYAKFRTCTVRRLTTHHWGKGDEPSVTFTVALAASPPKAS